MEDPWTVPNLGRSLNLLHSFLLLFPRHSHAPAESYLKIRDKQTLQLIFSHHLQMESSAMQIDTEAARPGEEPASNGSPILRLYHGCRAEQLERPR